MMFFLPCLRRLLFIPQICATVISTPLNDRNSISLNDSVLASPTGLAIPAIPAEPPVVPVSYPPPSRKSGRAAAAASPIVKMED
jgi:hypothetical protein